MGALESPSIVDVDYDALESLWQGLEPQLAACASLRAVAQGFVDGVADFVRDHSVRSVFGFGGSSVGGVMFLTTILFLRETIDRAQAVKFVPLIGSIKGLTTRLVHRGAIFDV